ncbi:S8 family serine peptidase [Tautonia marina]|uniref:S8 family serine peptidase n=1 Tax=Tautonia marina TaxID=2653855 RepID=UPI0012609A60|nr:S8 family serine peptidase [Tautonia marina]
MGSFKGDKRKPGRNRPRSLSGLARRDMSPERLEERTLLSSGFITPQQVTAAALNGPVFENGGKHLSELYEASRVGGNDLQQTIAAKSQFITFRNGLVGVDIYSDKTVGFDRLSKTLTDLGMQIVATDSRNQIVEGFVPLNQLGTIAQMAGVRTMTPIFTPAVRSQGSASNQANEVMGADVARSQFNVDGSGVTIGVISDSVSRFQGGLADSIASGDLPPLNRINVLLDEQVGGNNSDEGRAMMELIYDIAPGSNFAFHTGFLGPVGFADGVRRLAREAGSELIVDDVGLAGEPVFQPGLIAQAITDVTTADNVTYFSAAGNDGDQGIETNFRGVNATVNGVGAGRFLDFDPGPGVSTTLQVTTNQANSRVVMWWDDPWFTGAADTNLDFFLLDANGTVVASGVNNNIGSATPQEFEVIPAAGTYQLAIRVTGGPDPSRVRFQTFFDSLTVDQQFGNAGATTYPTTFGHPAHTDTIGVGAVNFFDAPPFSTQTPTPTANFTSVGPVLYFFDAASNRLPQSQLLLKPDVAGPQGTNTSFFGSDIPQDPDTNPNFFGTSAAAPNVTGVAALMKQLNPSSRPADIRQALVNTASPVNGTPARAWDNRGGFGLVDAVDAMTAIDQLRVVASTPANVAVLPSAPTFVELEFSKAIDPSSLQASDLTFPVAPNGVTISVGTPVVINPITVRFPITLNVASPDVQVNGTYVFRLADNAINAQDGSELIGLDRAFSINDVTAPRVTNTILQGRILVVQFSEAMRASTINKGTVQLIRTGGSGQFGNPSNVVVTDDPRALFFYDAQSNRAIYDLRALPQTVMPSDIYALVVSDQARDATGLRLDGNFTGQFPSGDGVAGGSFVQNLGGRLVTAPQIVEFGLSASSDTGLPSDRNTNQIRPTFTGFVAAQFPATNAGLQVAVQFIQDRPGGFDLDVGPNGEGFVGTPDLIVTTDSAGFFSFQAPEDLREGFHQVRIVVVGEVEWPPAEGKASRAELSFRVDTNGPLVTASSIPMDSRISNLRNITLNFSDPINPTDPSDPLAVPVQLDIPALDPRTAENLGNYSLINLGPDRRWGTSDDIDLSDFIQSATFTSTTNRTVSTDPYTAQVDLTFSDGLPEGRYALVARTQGFGFSGIRDASGNPLDNNTAQAGNQSFFTYFELQPEATFISGFKAFSPSAITPGTTAESGPRAFYEVPVPGFTPRAEAPPTMFHIDFSNSLEVRDYTNAVQLIRSADSAVADADGDFGLNGSTGFTTVSGLTVELTNSISGATPGQPGFQNRLVVRLPQGQTLEPDYYRIVLPNTGSEEIKDVFGNHADLEFLGNQKPTGTDFEVFMPDGTYRDGLTGDGVDGGTFVTGFAVVPGQRLGSDGRVRGNIIYTRPDYQDDPFLSTDDPDGSMQRPFATLLPEAEANSLNGGDLNSAANFGTGFNQLLDRNANRRFDRSAFFEAEQNRAEGPVVIVALPGIPRPGTGDFQTTQETFVIAPPAGIDPTIPEGNASGSVPEMTTLVFNPGSALKMFNASLFVQNQGSALQLRGGSNPGETVLITSFLDDTVGGDTNRDRTNTTPRGGDWGGIVFRNYDDVSNGRAALPAQFPVDGKLGLSGASDVMSLINHANIRFGGGAVPQTIGTRYDTITLFNSRPTITNTVVSDSQGAGGSQAAISADLDSLREDAIARGPLIRRVEFVENSINGILLRPAVGTLQAQETDAQFFPNNPSSQGGVRNFVIDDPIPYVLNSQVIIGQRLNTITGGIQGGIGSRLYVQPGMLIKSSPGSSIAVASTNASLNIGDRAYISQFDANPSFGPNSPNFRPSDLGDAKPLFTTLFDDAAETFFFDPTTGVRRTIVPANATDGNSNNPQPSPGNIPSSLRWGNISVTPGARAVIDEAEFRFGGGRIIVPEGGLGNRQVLNLSGFGAGAFVSVTNNDFYDNFDVPILVSPNQLLAADPTRPLLSGNPFFRGNVMERNSINGLGISTGGFVIPPVNFQGDFYAETVPFNGNSPNLTVDSVWDDTDIVHVLRGTVILAGWHNSGFGSKPVPSSTTFEDELDPAVSLTLQSALPDTLLSNGERIARPGEELVVKLFNDTPIGNPGPGDAIDPALSMQTPNVTGNLFGAGFNVGYDDGADPDQPSPTVDPGYGSQIRIVGIGSNESTGQQRVPVVITSLRDNTAGPVVRGVDQSDTWFADFRGRNIPLDTPAPGDGGMIGIGGGSLFDYNLFDPRNGSLIDNADIRYLHRIEFQAGGIVDAFDLDDSDAIDLADQLRFQKLGLDPATQYNAQHGWTVSNSNLSSFRDAGILADQGFDLIARELTDIGGNLTAGFPARISGQRGQPVNLFLVNNTIANMPVGVRVNATTGNNDTSQSPTQIVMLHNTFYNNGVGFRAEAPAYAGGPPPNSLSHVYFFGMNNIFDGGTIGSQAGAAAVRTNGMVGGSELLFNVFHNYTTNVEINNPAIAGFGFLGNNNPIFGDPRFLDPQNGNFFLQPGSVAIDAAISEIGPLAIGNMLRPVSNQVLDASGGIRNTTGRTNPFGSLGSPSSTLDVITLPGTPGRGFVDQFIPVLQGTPGGVIGPASSAATFAFRPLGGERDLEGFLRIDDPNTPNLGFGSRPYFDIGAREFRIFNPPIVTNQGATDVNGDGVGDGVTATIIDPTTGNPQDISIYIPGGVAGVNQSPQTLSFQINKDLDPQTVNSQTVLLQASGGDGIFGNANSPADRTIPLSGLVSFDPTTNRLVVELASANLLLSNDLYQITLVGTGGNVIRDRQGNALDGENLATNGLPGPLPSGDGFPGGNFILPFTIDTRAPEVVPGTFRLDPTNDPTFPVGITNVDMPTFVGRITDLFPPVNPLVNQTVVLDVDSNGDGVFDLIGIGQAITDANGNFVITANQSLPDSPFNVGPDGIFGTADDTGYSRARVRVTDVSGNESDPNDPNATIRFVLDTRSPELLSTTPADGSQVSSGGFQVSFTADENLLLSSLTAPGSIQVVGAGQDGVFGTGDDRTANVVLSSLNIAYLATAPSGPVRVSFNVTGADVNDIYRVTVNPSVTDRAGNSIEDGGFSIDIVVFTPGQERLLFVGPSGSFNPTGSRNNPFPTIAAGLAAATVGDTVAVLPGTYNEAVTLKSLVRLVSADLSSTDSNVVPGRAQATIIRAPLNPNGPEVTVTGSDLIGLGGDVDTELRGFAIVAPLSNVSTGQLQEDSTGLLLLNSGGLFHRNIIINGGRGIDITPRSSGDNARIESNVIVGNRTGLVIMDGDNTDPIDPVQVTNNTFALNNGGMVVYDAALNTGSIVLTDVANNIFWQNNDRTPGATDSHLAVYPPVAQVRGNMFGSNPNNPLLGFPVGAISTTPNPTAAFNYIGEPAFIAARDPRPGFDGPTVTLLDGNFGLTPSSAAIDAALGQVAPTLDFLGRARVDVPNRGFVNLGPADVGAYEFQPSSQVIIPGFPGIPGSPISPTPTPTPPGTILFGTPGAASPSEPGSPVNVGPNNPAVTFQPGTGVGRAAQTSGTSQATAGQARRDRDALRGLLTGKQTKVAETAPQGKRAWHDLISLTRFRRGN